MLSSEVAVEGRDPGVGRAPGRLHVGDACSPQAASAGDRRRAESRPVEFDSIVCDLMMPDMTGIQFHAEMERVESRLQREMIFITGGVFTDAAQQFLDSVPNRRLGKPFEIERLRKMIRE